MTDIASHFLCDWIKANVQDEAYVDGDDTDLRPGAYAATCLAAAERSGLTHEQLGKAASDLEGAPSLSAFMAITIDRAAQKRYTKLVTNRTCQ